MRLIARFRNYFLAGVLVTAPIGVTLWLAWKVVGIVDDLHVPGAPESWRSEITERGS